jgi:hypothetical protein
MRISEIKNEDALDMLADMIEPATEIMTDPKVQELIKAKNKGAIVKSLIKDHKKSIIEILAIIDGVPVEEYQVNVFTLPLKLIELLNDKELMSFFTSQAMMEEQTSSIEPMVITEDKEK